MVTKKEYKEIMEELYNIQKDNINSMTFMAMVYIITIGIAFWSVSFSVNNLSWSYIGFIFQGFHAVIILYSREHKKKLDVNFKEYLEPEKK